MTQSQHARLPIAILALVLAVSGPAGAALGEPGTEATATPAIEGTAAPTPPAETPAPEAEGPDAADIPVADAEPPAVAAAAEGVVRVQESDDRIALIGTWVHHPSSAFSGGAYAYSYTKGSTLTLLMRGTAVTIFGPRGPSYGKAEVFVDGDSRGVVDLYQGTYDLGATIFTTAGLADGIHTVTLKILGTASASSSGKAIVVDAIDVTGTVLDVFAPPVGDLPQGVEDSDPRVWYHGLWTDAPNSAASGGRLSYASVVGSLCEFTFSGTSVAWIGPRFTMYGQAEVIVDGVSHGIVDQYGPRAAHGQVIWHTTGLPDGPHKVTIKVRGTKSSASRGDLIVVDRFAVDEMLVPRHEETGSRVSLYDGWASVNAAGSSGSRYSRSSTRDAHAVIRFNGTSFRWVGPRGAGFGKAEVHLDGRLVGVVDQFAPTDVAQDVIWAIDGLDNAQHAVVIRVLATKRPEATGVAIGYDFAESVAGAFGEASWWPVRPTRIEDGDWRIAETGLWTTSSSSAFSGGAYSYSSRAGATLTARLNGPDIAMRGPKGPSYGRVEVVLDGVSQGVIDLYAPSYDLGATIFSATGLTPGAHTVVLRVLGTYAPGSSGAVVVVDALDAGGTPLALLDERGSGASRSSGWATASSPAMALGTYVYSRDRGATLTQRFIGSSVSVIGPRGPSYGQSEVVINGYRYGMIDQWAPTYSYGERLFERRGLADKENVVTVRVLGTKNASASNTLVVLDGFGVTGERVSARGRVTACAREQLDKQYVWAAEGPSTFDCSGLSLYCYRRAGISLPHYSGYQYRMCNPKYLDWKPLKTGDLAFTTDPSYIHHVGIYVGWGLTINAPGTGKFVEYRSAESYGCYGRIPALR
jgi:hypothetical protein